MKYANTIKIKCPYCDFENLVRPNVYSDKFEDRCQAIFYCLDESEGGCGEPFVIKPVLSLDMKIYRIEGCYEK